MPPSTLATSAWTQFAQLLEAQRKALIGGDVSALEGANAALQQLLKDNTWQTAIARAGKPSQLQHLQAELDINAQANCRAQASTHRALAALGILPTVYTAAGSLQSKNPFQRRTAA
jgi:hypothetical protein